MVKGTSGYMSPEQIRGEPLDARSDIFSLGVVLHECLTGMRLFHGKTPEEGMLSALREEIPPPSRLNPDVSPAIDAVVLKSLERDRDSRYATSLEFARAVRRDDGTWTEMPAADVAFTATTITLTLHDGGPLDRDPVAGRIRHPGGGTKFDVETPVVAGQAMAAPNARGWYGGNVTVRWTVTDNKDTIAAPANTGFNMPSAASGMPSTL
jgi:hypothetical protein